MTKNAVPSLNRSFKQGRTHPFDFYKKLLYNIYSKKDKKGFLFVKHEWKYNDKIYQKEDFVQASLLLEDIKVIIDPYVDPWTKEITFVRDMFHIRIYECGERLFDMDAPLSANTLEKACEYAEKLVIQLLKEEIRKWQRNLKVWEEE